MGGGDVKLLAAIGAIKGLPFIVCVTGLAVLVGGIMALWVMVRKGILIESFKRIFRGSKDKKAPSTIPFGVAVGVGCLIAIVIIG